jgi:NSS family neurotransmitter:Na+ symporter
MGLLGILIALGVEQGDLEAADRFLFRTHWSDFTGDSVLLALGHAFYTLGIGVAAGISFGSYAPDRFPIGRAVLSTAVVDTLIAIAAGLAIFPLLLAFNAEPAAGPGLVFISIPYALGNMAQGALAGTLFFCVVVLALVGSAVALLEPSVAVLMQQFRLRRRVAAPILVALVWLLSAVVALSLGGTGPSGLLVGLDSLTSRFLLPISALITTTFVAFCMHEGLLRAEFARESDLHYHTWHLLVRFVSVPAIVIILFWNLASR